MATFYKGVLACDLKENFIPGTVTKDKNEAVMWMERIMSKKNRGASRHIRHGESCLIAIEFDESLLHPHHHFQSPGVSEHDRNNCWTSAAKSKAQINAPITFRIVEL